jgi:hypothetical protein
MRAAGVLRAVAWLVALTAFIDPAIGVERERPAALRLVFIETASLDVAEGVEPSRRETLETAVAGLQAALGNVVSVHRVPLSEGHAADWCAGADVCVAVGDDRGSPALVASISAPFALVAGDAPSPNVSVTRVSAPDAQHVQAFGRLRVALAGRDVVGRTTTVRVLDEGREVGAASTEWTAAEERVELNVEWWPADTGVRRLTVEAVPLEGEATTLDNRLDVAVDVVSERLRVLVYEPRPSWTSTFVRRAIEADPRLDVTARSRVSTGLTVATAGAPGLTASDLDELSAVVVGGIDDLQAAEVDLLHQYAVQRGGSVLLLPDRWPEGPVRRLLPRAARERLVAQPLRAGVLQATEFTLFPEPSPPDRVLAALDEGTAVVVESPLGLGHLVVVGAMDAWRYRDEQGRFDGFWRALVARLARRAGEPFEISPRAAMAAPGETVRLDVRWRSLGGAADVWPAMHAWMTCEGGAQVPARVWPAPAPGHFHLEVVRDRPGRCVVEAARADAPAEGRSAVIDVRKPLNRGGGPRTGALAAVAEAHGGRAFRTDEVDGLAQAIRTAIRPDTEAVESRPMRTPWWIALFAGALGGEWWLRRRHGRR